MIIMIDTFKRATPPIINQPTKHPKLSSQNILYYKAKSLCICLFVCLFSLCGKKLTNRLTQTHTIGNECRVIFSCSNEHIFNLIRFVIQKLRVFLQNELKYLAYATRTQNT